MQLSDLLSVLCKSKYGTCERCHQEAYLKRVKVKAFDGMAQYKYLCFKCSVMEK